MIIVDNNMGNKKKSYTVLVIEDEPLLRKVAVNKLKKAGLKVIEASDGNEALEQIKKMAPDYIWLDLYMPRMDGFEFMKQISETKEYARIPLLIVSVSRSFSSAADIPKGLNVKGNISKSDTTLQDIVDKVVSEIGKK